MQTPPLIYLERYRNKGTRTYSNQSAYTEAEDQYRPDSSWPEFGLPLFKLPVERITVYKANPPEALESEYLGHSRAWFCIHPQVLDACPNDLYVRDIQFHSTDRKTIHVIPTSSTRTLYVQNQDLPHALKVHFPFKVSRYFRRMRDEVVEQAVNTSRELEDGIHHLDDQFGFFREVIGVVYKNLQPDSTRGENWGYLVRDMTPFPVVPAQRTLIPGFALYGEDFFDSHAPLLLYDLIGTSDPVAFVLDNIMLPIIRHWVECYLNFGYLIEPHGQNVLFEVNQENRITRVIHRDLNVGIHMRRRRDIGLPDHHINPYNRMEHNAFLSITYDRFMGGHFFDRIVSACQIRYPKLSEEDFRIPCREEFCRIFPGYEKYLPEKVWYFTDDRDEFDKPLYQDTGINPEWRP